MVFKIKIEPEAHQDIQEGIDWYKLQQAGLGRKFHAEVKAAFKNLKTNPFFQERYDGIHCLPLKKFPYMVHFSIHEQDQLVIVRAIFNTSIDPKAWKNRQQ